MFHFECLFPNVKKNKSFFLGFYKSDSVIQAETQNIQFTSKKNQRSEKNLLEMQIMSEDKKLFFLHFLNFLSKSDVNFFFE